MCGSLGLVSGGAAGGLLVIVALSTGKVLFNTEGTEFKISEGSKWGCASGACSGVVTGCATPLLGLGIADSLVVSSLSGGLCGAVVAAKVPSREELFQKHLDNDCSDTQPSDCNNDSI